MRTVAERLFGWTPFRVAWHGPEMLADWLHLGDARMTEPFFYQTIVNAVRQPFNLVFQQRTPMAALAELPPGLPPMGFIFHMSRCGSTLVAQALAALEQAIVVSEAAPIRAVLRAANASRTPSNQAEAWLGGLVNAFAQQRFSYERGLFVKFMAADMLDFAMIRRTFPRVPWLFLYRDPLEILASLRALGGADSIIGLTEPHRLGLTHEQVARFGWQDYQLHTLVAFARAALAAHAECRNGVGGRGMILDYAALPEALETIIPAHFDLVPDEGARTIMRAAAARDAKAPHRAFHRDGAAKRTAAAPWAEAAERIAGETFAALDRAKAA